MHKVLGELEEKVMQVMWRENVPLKPADVQGMVSGSLAYTTIMTVLQRLTRKGLLGRHKHKNTYYYRAQLTKDKYVRQHVGNFLSSIISSYGKLAVSQFVDTIKDDPNYRQLLADYLSQTDHERA